MKIILFLLAILLFTSCVTKKACDQRFPPQIVIKDSIVLKDTTLYVSVPVIVPADTVTLIDSIPCDITYEKEQKKGSQSAKVIIDKGIITVECRSDSLVKVIDSLKVVVQNKEKYQSEVKVIEGPERVRNKVPPWCWYLLSANIVFLLIKFRNPIISLLKSFS